MEVKLEKLESIFQKGLLPEDEYKQMRVKAIKESLGLTPSQMCESIKKRFGWDNSDTLIVTNTSSNSI